MKRKIAIATLAFASLAGASAGGFVTHMSATVVNPLVGRRGHGN